MWPCTPQATLFAVGSTASKSISTLGGNRFLLAFVVVHRQRQLPQIVLALAPPRRLARRLNRRQQQRHQDADDGDHHQ